MLPSPSNPSATDLLNQLASLDPGSPTAELRAGRPDVARYAQGSYDALLAPADPAGVSLAERALIALRVAVLSANQPLTAHYRAQLVQLNVAAPTIAAVEQFPATGSLTSRLTAILRHVDRLTNEPHRASAAHIAELQAEGLSASDIVTIAQLIAFLTFQVRLLVGVQLLAGEKS